MPISISGISAARPKTAPRKRRSPWPKPAGAGSACGGARREPTVPVPVPVLVLVLVLVVVVARGGRLAGEDRLALDGDLADELFAAAGDRLGHRGVLQVVVELLTLVGCPPQRPRQRNPL